MKYFIKSDFCQAKTIEEFTNLKEAKQAYKEYGYQKHSEAWIEDEDGKTVFPKHYVNVI